MNIFIDIETIPCQRPELIEAIRADMVEELEESLAAVKAPANYKDAEKIAEFMATTRAKLRAEHDQKVQTAIERTGLDGALGELFCIGVAFDNEEPIVIDGSELQQLQSLWALLRERHTGSSGMRPLLIGHNLAGFDIPFLWKRSIINNVPPPFWFPRNPKPWSDAIFDTMSQWDSVNRISMDRLCRALGIPGKGDISGKDVWPLVQTGRGDEVKQYCADDVRRTREIWRLMTFN